MEGQLEVSLLLGSVNILFKLHAEFLFILIFYCCYSFDFEFSGSCIMYSGTEVRGTVLEVYPAALSATAVEKEVVIASAQLAVVHQPETVLALGSIGQFREAEAHLDQGPNPNPNQSRGLALLQRLPPQSLSARTSQAHLPAVLMAREGWFHTATPPLTPTRNRTKT